MYRRRRRRGASFPPARFDYDDPIQFLQHIFENPFTNIHATLDVIRASLPALMEGLASSNEPGNHGSDDDEEIMDGSIDPLELLVRQLPLPPPLCHEAPCRCNSNFSPLATMSCITTYLEHRKTTWLCTTKQHPPRMEIVHSQRQWNHSRNMCHYRRRHHLRQKCVPFLSLSLHICRRDSAR